MDRRVVLSSVGVGIATLTGGCVANGRVAADLSKSVTVEPTEGWWTDLPPVDGDAALSLTVRADQRFDIYYFQREASLTRYKNYLYKDDDSEMPTGHEDFSQTALPIEDGNQYEVAIPDDGGRKSVDTEGDHYFVVDHSNYAMGVRVEGSQDRLDAFVDLKVYEDTSII